MGRKIRKHVKIVYPIEIPIFKENLRSYSGSVPLNKALSDRISFSVLKNDKDRIKKIENISYEINIDDKWEWVVRYDDHGGIGPLHRHFRISLTDTGMVESSAGIKRYKNKDQMLTWVFRDITRNYLAFRKKFLKNCGLDLY